MLHPKALFGVISDETDTGREVWRPRKGTSLTTGDSSSPKREKRIRENRISYCAAVSQTVLSFVLLSCCATHAFSQFTRSRSPNNEPQSPTSERTSTTSGQRPMPPSPLTSAQQVPGAAKTSPAVSSLSL